MDLLSLLLLIVLVLWLTGALGAPSPAPNVIWIILIVAVILWLGGGYTGYHSGHWFGRC